MKHRNAKLFLILGVLILLCVVLFACEEKVETADGRPVFEDENYVRTIPEIIIPEYVGTRETTEENNGRRAVLDTTNANKGYFAVSVYSATRAKLEIKKGTDSSMFDLSSDGVFSFFSFSMGNGSYDIRIYLNLPEAGADQYELFLQTSEDVTLEDAHSPFLIPTQLVSYDKDSESTKYSYELAAHAKSDLEVVQQIYHYITNNIVYNTAFAEEIKAEGGRRSYTPDPDVTLREKRGICYDYAALIAAMLRANAIPCQLVFGYVSDGDESYYHAWNNIWLDDVGWITVKIPSTPGKWLPLDTTLAAGIDPALFPAADMAYKPTAVH